MYYILHDPDDGEAVNKDIVPLLKDKEIQLEHFPLQEELQVKEEDVILLYLKEEDLKTFLGRAAKNQWLIGILPHPDLEFAVKGLGISGDMEETVAEVLEDQPPQKLDFLCCEDQPVFQSVNIGEIFLLADEKGKKNFFFFQLMVFFRNIRRISGLSHRSFELSTGGEKVIKTSALGLVVVEHALSSIVSKKLVDKSSIHDGMFHVLIMAPENVFVLLTFLLRSLFSGTRTMKKMPSFIGHLKTPKLEICTDGELQYTIDGKKATTARLHLEVQEHPLLLKQKSIYSGERPAEAEKKTIKVENLPTGEKRAELIKRKLPILPRATTEEFQDLFKVLRENALITSTFLVTMVLSTLIATFGLYADSSPVIIGAMILAPIIAPIVSFSMGMVRYDVHMLKKSFLTISAGTVVSLLFAAGVSLIIPLKIITPEIEARLSPTLLDLGIAVASGIAAAYAHAKEGIARSLAGVAIAVALVPPLAVAGIGLGWWDWNVFFGAFLLYLTNLAGIIMFGGLTFLLLGFAPFKRARMGLIYTFLIILAVMVPLSLSFNRIMEEAQITKALEGTTYEDVVLRDVKVRFGQPMVVSLKLVGPELMEPDKIRQIKAQIEAELDHPVVLEVVSAVEF